MKVSLDWLLLTCVVVVVFVFFFEGYCDHRDLHVLTHSFPTRRSSDLLRIPFTTGILIGIGESWAERIDALFAIRAVHERYGHIQEVIIQNFRSEEHTSELQSLMRISSAVSCLQQKILGSKNQ